jgi:hypothetical protein
MQIDRYETRELIGRGGRDTVYRAVDTRLGRTVALKVIGGALDEPARDRFMRDIGAASRIDHPNLVHVLDFGVAPDDGPYVVMELLRGETLESRLRARPLAVSEAADLVLSVCAALRAGHRVGVVHGALAPRKIFLHATDMGEQVKVRDAGLSSAAAEPADDQRALGAVLDACFAGQPPPGLDAIVRKAATPGDQYDSVHALGQALSAFASAVGQRRWRGYIHEAASNAGAATQVDVPAKELEATLLLPSERAPGLATLPIPVPGGTEIAPSARDAASETGGSVMASAADVSWTAPVRRRPLVPIAAAAVGAVLAITLVVLMVGGRTERVQTASPPPPRVTPEEQPPPPPPREPALREPPPPPRATTDEGAKRPAHAKHPSRRRQPWTLDAHGIGIPAD